MDPTSDIRRAAHLLPALMMAGLVISAALAIAIVVAVSDPALAQDSWPPPTDVSAEKCSTRLVGSQTTYDVGPGREHTELTTVPWLSLGAGDVVNIHYRTEPYRTKIGLRAQGTAANPVMINGVTDPMCRRPVFSGSDAVTAADAAATGFFSVEYTEFLGTIFMYRSSSDPYGYRPKHITIQNLVITGASTEDSYTAMDGTVRNYGQGAAGVYAVVVEDLTLINNEIVGNGNGVFVNSKSVDEASARIMLRRNEIHSNGTPGSYLEHNIYVQAQRTLYEGNYLGQLVPGAEGSSLKDRSSGTVIRYNHIDAAARAIDLVEIEGGVPQIFEDPLYHDAHVYGNVIITDHSRPSLSGALLIHWGGDGDPRYYRNGTLYFYNNTVLIRSTREQRYYFVLFDMFDNQGANEQRVEASSNIFASLEDALLYLARDFGQVELTGTNWISEGFYDARPDSEATVVRSGQILTGLAPGLDAAGRPIASSPVIDQAASPNSLDVTVPQAQYGGSIAGQGPGAIVARQLNGAQSDLGAFEAAAGQPPGVDTGPEVMHALSCLGANGRVDTNIVNTGGAAATYRIEFQGLSPRQMTVEAGDWWRMPITGRPDGDFDVVIKRNGVEISSTTVTVRCDNAPPVVDDTEVRVVNSCRDGNGYVLFQFVNNTPTSAAYVIAFDGVANRSTSAAAYGQSIRAVTGRPNGAYTATVLRNGQLHDSRQITVSC